MAQGVDLRNMYESMRAEATDPRHGATKFCTALHDWMGIEYVDYGAEKPRARLKPRDQRKATPETFAGSGMQELNKAIFGSNERAVEVLSRRGDYRSGRAPLHESVSLHEAGNTAVQPSQFIDINVWDNTVGGLVEAKVIEGFETPEFIGEQLTKNDPRKTNGGKTIGIGRIGDKAEVIAPGQPHPRVQFTERYITVPGFDKRGLAIDITKEAAFFDLTGMVLKNAESLGREVALRKEKRIFNMIIGAVNPYNYGGVAYNTYLASGNWINTNSNPLSDYANLNAAWYLFSKMQDQESSQRVTIRPDTILCTPYLLPTLEIITTARGLTSLTSGSASVYNAGNRTEAPNITDYFGRSLSNYRVFSSSILQQQLTDSVEGLNLADTNARQYWYVFDRARAFAYWENWPLTVTSAPANDYIMADNDLVLSTFANERGTPYVLDPRYVVQNTN